MKQPYRDQDLLVRDIRQLASELSSPDGGILISIDGLGGAGKTTLAGAIAATDESIVIALDNYLIPDRGSYLPHLRYQDIDADLTDAESRGARFIIVEGFCVLAALETLGRRPNIAVYIRRVDEFGHWKDEFDYSEENDLEEVMGRISEMEAHFPHLPGIGASDRELATYHIEKKPISNADFVYDRIRRYATGEEASA